MTSRCPPSCPSGSSPTCSSEDAVIIKSEGAVSHNEKHDVREESHIPKGLGLGSLERKVRIHLMCIVHNIFSLIIISRQTCWLACDIVHTKDLFHNFFFEHNPRLVDAHKLDIFVSLFKGPAPPRHHDRFSWSKLLACLAGGIIIMGTLVLKYFDALESTFLLLDSYIWMEKYAFSKWLECFNDFLFANHYIYSVGINCFTHTISVN